MQAVAAWSSRCPQGRGAWERAWAWACAWAWVREGQLRSQRAPPTSQRENHLSFYFHWLWRNSAFQATRRRLPTIASAKSCYGLSLLLPSDLSYLSQISLSQYCLRCYEGSLWPLWFGCELENLKPCLEIKLLSWEWVSFSVSLWPLLASSRNPFSQISICRLPALRIHIGPRFNTNKSFLSPTCPTLLVCFLHTVSQGTRMYHTYKWAI